MALALIVMLLSIHNNSTDIVFNNSTDITLNMNLSLFYSSSIIHQICYNQINIAIVMCSHIPAQILTSDMLHLSIHHHVAISTILTNFLSMLAFFSCRYFHLFTIRTMMFTLLQD